MKSKYWDFFSLQNCISCIRLGHVRASQEPTQRHAHTQTKENTSNQHDIINISKKKHYNLLDAIKTYYACYCFIQTYKIYGWMMIFIII